MQAQGRRTQPEAKASPPTADAGSSYRFLVRSAEEAVGAIRTQLGDEARVVSVRAVKASGLAGLMGGTRLEVIAQKPALSPAPVEPETKPDTFEAVSMVSSPAPARRAATPAVTYAAASATTGEGARMAAAATVAAAAESVVRQAPAAPRLEALLRRSGLSESLISRLQAAPGWPGAENRPLHQGLSAVAGQIRELAAGVAKRPLPARAAFIGLPGVGCTTALCKWMATEVFGRGRHGVAASIEFDRPKGAEELAVFAELLGVDFARQVPAATGDRFCYVDVPPLSLTREEENRRLRAFLDEQRLPGRVLVLSGLQDATVLRQASAIGLELGCTHLVFTQLDELPQWGKLWDFLIETPLTPLLATCGPSLTGECETDVVGTVLRRTFPWN